MAKNLIPKRDDSLVEKLYQISDGDTNNPGILPAGLGATAKTDADEFHDAIANAKNKMGAREEAVAIKKVAHKALRLALAKGTDYLKAVGLRSKALRAPWRLDRDLPPIDADLISVADVALTTDAALPPGDPHKFPAALRTAMQTGHDDLQTAVQDASTKGGEAENAVADKNMHRAKCVLTYKIARDHLYATLPLGKKDPKLELFGFDRWDPHVRHRKPGPPTPP